MTGAWEAIAGAVGFVLFVAVSGFFSGMAAGLIAINRFRLRHEAEIEREKRAGRVVALFDNARRVLAVSLIGSTLANVAAFTSLVLALTSLSKAPDLPIGWRTSLLALVIALPILLIAGEVIPRHLLRERADRILVSLYYPLRWSLTALGPLARAGIWLAQRFGRGGLRGLPSGTLAPGEPWQSLLETGEKSSPSATDMETTENRMIHGIFDLQKTRVRQIMRPLVDLVIVHLPEQVGTVRQLARHSGYSRFPAYRDRIINLVGYLDIYDILAGEIADDQPADDFVREAFYVPETKRLDDLLQEMLRDRRRVAIVADEYGSCSGWVTRGDLLEEIVGEIEDEFDKAVAPIRQVDQPKNGS